ncbi:DUF61 family protein [Ignicoccus hospitalis]|uniref:DUF61 domain-containing protein n=1 Tax=Ignicoccus hospitalis (strain KIN4/I / DSM 18386 / JCM 14125) TaxID=453591 RepID=A8ACB9_IGNH4|nr:DUF61 family protein [Ignicoccus hospitalis]ABU82571.1 hypothetical protein Igni_1395 [Ignicoccus hospitalis KIN4/I]HIH90736.1 DUF61 family protein [Desulfurococcaceae archaeon]
MTDANGVVRNVIEEFRSINQSVPQERVLLKAAAEGRRLIKLRDGSEHLMDTDELNEMINLLPSWMKWVVRVPLLLAYEPLTGVVKVLGSEWDEKAVRRLVGIDKEEPLRLYHLERLITRFSSLVFIIFEVDVARLVGVGEDVPPKGFG